MVDKRVKIGVVGVDSGQLVITDPCYIHHDGEQKELNDYNELLRLREERGESEHYTQLNYDKGHAGLGVMFDSGMGDGVYDVYATIGKVHELRDRVVKVEIILVEERE